MLCRLAALTGTLAVSLALMTSTAGVASAAPLPARFSADNVAIRTAPQPAATIVGRGQQSHSVTFICYARGDRPAGAGNGNVNNVWARVTDNTTRRTGFVWASYVRVTSSAARDTC